MNKKRLPITKVISWKCRETYVDSISKTSVQTSAYRVQLLAPTTHSWFLGNTPIAMRGDLYRAYLSSMQKLRGTAYLSDGAIRICDLDEDGRHVLSDDPSCWHLLLLDRHSNVIACTRYLVHSTDTCFDRLRLAHAAIAHHPSWGPKLKASIEVDLARARARNIRYVEIGGWAIDSQYRKTTAALDTLLGSYAWGEMMGGCICLCTATHRNHSASILRRIGGTSIRHLKEEIPSYFDPQYGCMMDILRFTSANVANQFSLRVADMKKHLTQGVIVGSRPEVVDLTKEGAFQNSLVALASAVSWNANTFAALQKLERPHVNA